MIRIFKHYIPWSLALLVIAECLIVFGSVYAAAMIQQFWQAQPLLSGIEATYPKALVITLAATVTFYVVDLYDKRLPLKRGELVVRIATSLVIIFFIVALLSVLLPVLQLSVMDYALSLVVFLPGITIFRVLYHLVLNSSKERVLILGVNDIAHNIARELVQNSNHSFEVQGLVSENGLLTGDVHNCHVMGSIKDLVKIVQENRPNILVVALSERRGMFPYKEILDCKLQGIRVEDWPTFYEKLTGKIIIQNLRPSWLIFADGFVRNSLTRRLKSITDLILAIVGLCFASPLIALISLLTKLDSRGPVFFRQERVGENGRIFTLYKFRTMVQDAEKETGPVWSQDTDPRITRLGKLLRRTGLDEIPQMFNVLRGDMSFVGPRPERPHFVADLQEKIPYYTQRLVVKPGITGWAQVRYGYGATIEDAIEKLQFDLYYIKNMSFFLDMLIILSTAHKVLFAKVALQTNAAEVTTSQVPQSQEGLAVHNFGGLTTSALGVHGCQTHYRVEVHGQESESSR